jgi:hypothetical protein
MKNQTIIWTTFVLVLLAITIQSCKKDEPAEGIDLELFNMAEETSGFTWYKNSDAWLPKSAGSGHNYTSLRTRYNTIASTQLDGDGKVMANASFPEGSLVVKELSSSSSVERYAILYKRSDSEHADANGWVWGYVNSDGTVATTAEDKGAICTGCHLQPDNIDYMLMNKFFP